MQYFISSLACLISENASDFKNLEPLIANINKEINKFEYFKVKLMQEERYVIENVVINAKFIQYLNGLIILSNYVQKLKHFLNFINMDGQSIQHTHNELRETVEKIKEFVTFLKNKQINVSKFQIALFDSLVFSHNLNYF